jgi:uncharacterized protein YkwD
VPHEYRRFAIAVALLAAVGCASPTAPDAIAGPAGIPSSAIVVTSTVLERTNAERARAGLAPLRESTQLQRAAQLHSEQMGAAARYPWQAYGENIAMGQSGGAEVVSAWMQSAGHRANILNPKFTELGVGVALDHAGRPYYAQVFGRPSS